MLLANNHSLPDEALYIIRYNSLQLLYNSTSYDYLMDDKDKIMKNIVKEFNKYVVNINTNNVPIIKWDTKLREYYSGLIKKYISKDLLIYN